MKGITILEYVTEHKGRKQGVEIREIDKGIKKGE